MTRLIIAEKPSMGRAIATALGVQGSGRSFIQSGDLIVTWCVGHLVEAIEPEGYDPELKRWNLDVLPFFPLNSAMRPSLRRRISSTPWLACWAARISRMW